MNKSDIDLIASLYKSLWVNCKASDGTFAEIYNCFKNRKIDDVEKALRACAMEKSFEPSIAEIREHIPSAKKAVTNRAYVSMSDSELAEWESMMFRRGFRKEHIRINENVRGYEWRRGE